MTEKEKAASISKLLGKASKVKRKAPVKVVVARGANKGKGRPAGVRGKLFIIFGCSHRIWVLANS
jgi:AdoMet-dependent rRNA methyltransferase SPB1